MEDGSPVWAPGSTLERLVDFSRGPGDSPSETARSCQAVWAAPGDAEERARLGRGRLEWPEPRPWRPEELERQHAPQVAAQVRDEEELQLPRRGREHRRVPPGVGPDSPRWAPHRL